MQYFKEFKSQELIHLYSDLRLKIQDSNIDLNTRKYLERVSLKVKFILLDRGINVANK